MCKKIKDEKKNGDRIRKAAEAIIKLLERLEVGLHFRSDGTIELIGRIRELDRLLKNKEQKTQDECREKNDSRRSNNDEDACK